MERTPEKIQEAIENSAKVRLIHEVCTRENRTEYGNRTGAMVYREGAVGELAGAVAAYYGEHRSPGWRAWLEAARVYTS